MVESGASPLKRQSSRVAQPSSEQLQQLKSRIAGMAGQASADLDFTANVQSGLR